MVGATQGARHRFTQRRKALGFTQETLAERLNVERSTVVRWEAGKNEPLAWIRPKLAATLKVTPEQLDGLLATDSPKISSALSLSQNGQVEDDMNRLDALKILGAAAAPLSGAAANISELVLYAARSSAALRASVEVPGISQSGIVDARQRLHRLATDYVLTSELGTLSDLIKLRDELHATLTTRQHHPRDTRDLHVLLGAACVLMASISHDLSEPQAGMTQARTAQTFAELSGHRGLLTWVYCTKAMIASWWATPAEVLHHSDKANAVGVAGISAIRLAGLQARALSQLGRRAEAIAALQLAQEQREKVDGRNDLEELGQVFTFPPPRQHYYNAATHLHLGNWADVERETANVSALYDQPAAGQTWPVTLTLTRIYQARARLHVDGPEGAAESLRPVLAIPANQWLPQTRKALTGLRIELQKKSHAALPAARDLTEAINTIQSLPVSR